MQKNKIYLIYSILGSIFYFSLYLGIYYIIWRNISNNIILYSITSIFIVVTVIISERKSKLKMPSFYLKLDHISSHQTLPLALYSIFKITPVKTGLYIIYAVVIFVSCLYDFDKSILNNKFIIDFLLINKSSIIILIAFDRIVSQHSKEKLNLETSIDEYIYETNQMLQKTDIEKF